MSRIVMFVFNDCTTDARVLREAESLAAIGHQVTIMARPRDLNATTIERERRNGFEIVRVPLPQGWKRWYVLARYPWRARGWIRFRFAYDAKRGPAGWAEALAITPVAAAWIGWMLVRAPFYLGFKLLRRGRPQPGGDVLDWLVRWRFSIVGWARAAASAAPRADVYHGHDLSGLPGAVAAAEREARADQAPVAHGGDAAPRAAPPAGRVGRTDSAGSGGGAGTVRLPAGGQAPSVVYDSHEIYVESGRIARLPRWVRGLLARQEQRWVDRAAALVTVNQSLADDLSRRYHPARTVVVHNCPSRWIPPDPRPDLLRQAAGIPPEAPVALYHGGFSLHRGMEELAAALLEPGMEDVYAAYLGYGSERPRLDAMAADPRYGGRLRVLDAVPPDGLLPWVASADVGVMPIQRSTLNHYLSTPNKLFESLAAGVPVVVSDFPDMRRIALDDPDGPLGAVCDPSDPASVARAIRSILDLDAGALAGLRRRCLRAAHERYNWETEVARLFALYAELPGGALQSAGATVVHAASPADGG